MEASIGLIVAQECNPRVRVNSGKKCDGSSPFMTVLTTDPNIASGGLDGVFAAHPR